MVPSGRSRILRLHPMYPWRGGGKRKTTRMTMTAASLRGSLRQRAVQHGSKDDPKELSLKHRFSRVGISLLVSPKIIFTSERASERTSEDSSVRALTKCSPCIYKTMFWRSNRRGCDHRTGDCKDFQFSAGIISDVSCIFFFIYFLYMNIIT